MANSQAFELTEVIRPWEHARVMALLRRWWQLQESGCSKWPMDRISGVAFLPARELALTVSVWIDQVQLGLRKWYPERKWGREPVVVRWLRAADAADETRRRAEAFQRQAMLGGRMRAEKDHLRRMWRAAEGASVAAFKLQNSTAFDLFIRRLAVAMALCSAEDPAFRKLLNDPNLGW